MSTLRWIYKTIRSLLLTLILLGVGLVVILYVLLSIPPVQNSIKDVAQKELSQFFGQSVEIGSLDIFPLNELSLKNVTFTDPYGKKCVEIDKLGGGINFWRLIFTGKIEITYIELVGFRTDIYQKQEDQPLNIDFIIKAFESKDKNKPPTKFDLKIHNIVLRKGRISYSKLWKTRSLDPDRIDFNYIILEDLNADVALPRLSNELNEIDLRRLAFKEKSGLIVKEIGGFFSIGPNNLGIRDFIFKLPESEIELAPVTVPLSLLGGNYSNERIRLRVTDSKLTPADISALVPALAGINYTLPFSAVVSGNMGGVNIEDFLLKFPDEGGSLKLSADIRNINKKGQLSVTTDAISFDIQKDALDKFSNVLPISLELRTVIENLIYIRGKLSGKYSEASEKTEIHTEISTGVGELRLETTGMLSEAGFDGSVKIDVPDLDIEKIAAQSTVSRVSSLKLSIEGNVDFRNVRRSSGKIDFNIGRLGILKRELDAIEGTFEKSGSLYAIELSINDNDLDGILSARMIQEGSTFILDLDADINDFDTYNSLLAESQGGGVEMRGKIRLHGSGSGLDDASGILELEDIKLATADGRHLSLDSLWLQIDQKETQDKTIILRSEVVDIDLEGNYILSAIPAYFKESIADICPAVISPSSNAAYCGSGRFVVNVKDAEHLIDFFSIPILPLTELTIEGSFDSQKGLAMIKSDIPYIQQGKNNLVRDTYINLEINKPQRNATFNFGTIYPTKKGDLKIDLDLRGGYGEYFLTMDFNKGLDTKFYGETLLKIKLDRDIDRQLEAIVEFLPSSLYLNGSLWEIGNSTITYNKNLLDVEGFSVRHDEQYVTINGSNAKDGSGIILLQLADINLDYLFDTLNIPHVNFGGNATGEMEATGLLSNDINARTKSLFIKDLSYNGGLVGDGKMYGILDLREKMVKLGGKISEQGSEVADVTGGVWFGRDSLSFDFDTRSVNIEFLEPFMQAFSSKVTGRASGKAKLFGTFSDIDMIGTLVAEDANILIDYINVTYTASDTVYMYPGRIVVPEVTIHDKTGGSAKVKGTITHDYFHNPAFQFNIDEMDHLLVYDTNKKINNIWYGTIYAKGAGEITGEPGWVRIRADVETQSNSDFTFVLSDEQEAVKTSFLTFTDRRKEAYEASLPKDEKEEEPEFLRRFRKKVSQQQQGEPDVFLMDLRATITPAVKLNLIMDPVAGDKITAQGEGAMNMTYSSKSDELRLYGKYILDKGSYNFSLQDIILKEFTIKPGSSIAFTGDPYSGILDITAAYRVNTNLTELDQSFATDRELNRTSVPVEALLKVTGPLMSPHIGFDIELPTVTEETQRKVKSIISTEDMMSKEVLYLVALNKFYPPEYMATSNSGGEWASVASSTISSQIQNIIGQLTDKFTLAPSFRSDKGDFSDVEVDVALSSNLFNNRLLLNGNFGYRDPSNSSTMFVGDFDLEYLLTKSGNWRLKAYNHFNDQNYYLKSALTTQGLGIVWRKDFGYLQGNKKSRKNKETKEEKTDDDQSDVKSGNLIDIESEEIEEVLDE